MRIRPAFAALALILAGCAEGAKEDTRPPDILAPERMVHLIAQAHIQEAGLQVRRLEARTAKLAFDRTWDSITKAAGTDTAAFARSYGWYARHVPELDAVYEQVVDSIGIEESRARAQDSTRKAKVVKPAADTAKKDSVKAALAKAAKAKKDSVRHHLSPKRAKKKPRKPAAGGKTASPAGTGPGSAVQRAMRQVRAKR